MDEYEDRFVAFVDILGFKDLIKRTYGPNKSVDPSQIREALQVPDPVEREMVVVGRIGDIADSGHRMAAFSDCVVITTDPSENGLIHILHHIAKIGFRLIQLGFLCRGGVSRGLVYHQNEMVFGPALIDAYRLEQSANMPRVILQEEVMNMGLSVESPVHKIFRKFTRKDNDGKYYVNTLRVIRQIMDTESGPPDEIREMCNRIERHLLNELARLSKDIHKKEKVEWFKNYFDWARDRSGWDYLNQPFLN